ncbi:DUF4238 domain-containing protein [Heyndrickxia oleronia]|uniref:DUF4238 domain-containing protein n=1 Tax=Heyndrickxia oleronia TaxID=38875 RepID=UPI001C0F2DE2|nr:DUF4238 domain-containing protein [Heyndrickxia oleronia]MBU5214582.1 DUF4238 domain-containing protein [Heyndrickxia oleronia]
MSDPVKQHYVPQSYLNYFTNESGNLHAYVKKSDRYIQQTPRNTGYQKHFYTLDINGEKDYSIEKMLAEHVDSLYKPVIEKINNNEPLTTTDKQNLAIFIAFQHLRTPAQRKNYDGSVDDFYKQVYKIIFEMKKVYNLHDGLNETEINQLQDIVQNEKYEVQVPKENSLKFMLDFSEKMSSMLSKHNFVILKASKKSSFITTDNPYCMVKENWSPEWSGYGIINTKKFFPLTPRYLLMLKDPGDKIFSISLSKDQVRHLNLIIAYWSDNFIYSHNEYLLKSIVKKLNKHAVENQ